MRGGTCGIEYGIAAAAIPIAHAVSVCVMLCYHHVHASDGMHAICMRATCEVDADGGAGDYGYMGTVQDTKHRVHSSGQYTTTDLNRERLTKALLVVDAVDGISYVERSRNAIAHLTSYILNICY